MSIMLDHTIVLSPDKLSSALFLGYVLGRPYSGAFARFAPVQLDDELNIDFADAESDDFERRDFTLLVLEFVPRVRVSGKGGERHFCFRVGDQEFDQILIRVRGDGIKVRSDPGGPSSRIPNDEINYYHHGRGFYFSSPDGHGYEVIT